MATTKGTLEDGLSPSAHSPSHTYWWWAPGGDSVGRLYPETECLLYGVTCITSSDAAPQGPGVAWTL